MKSLMAAASLVLFAVGSAVGTSRLVLLHAEVIDVRTGFLEPDMTVIVIGSRISTVIPASQFQDGPEDRVIDVSGNFVIPGHGTCMSTSFKGPMQLMC